MYLVPPETVETGTVSLWTRLRHIQLTGQQTPNGFRPTRSGRFASSDARTQYRMDGDGATERRELRGLLKNLPPVGGTALSVDARREELREIAGLQVGGRVDHAEDLAS